MDTKTLAGGQIMEQDFPLYEGKMDPDVERSIVAKQIAGWRYDWTYWCGALDRGERYWKDLIGDIYTPTEEAWYKAQNKLLFKIPELVPKINALEGMQIGARRTGTVVAVGDEDTAPTAVAEHILREDIQRKNDLPGEITRCFTDGIVSSFPQAMWFDAADKQSGKHLDVYHGQWNDTLPDPGFTRPDYSDATRVRRARTMTRDQLLMRYPQRADRINQMLPAGSAYDRLSIASFGGSDSEATRSDLVKRLDALTTQYAQNGLVYVIETLFFVNRSTTVWRSPRTTKVETLPPEWTQAEINRWKEFHPEYTALKEDVRVLWVTAVTPFGVVLENRPHWFQKQEFPVEFYIPRLWNNKIHGIVEFLSGSLKGRNVTKIEYLHSLRMANDNVMVVKEGALANPESAAAEKGRAGGIIVLKRLAQMDHIAFPLSQRENLGWRDMSDTFLDDMDRLSVDRNYEGGMVGSQQSGKAKDISIGQTQNKHLAYLTSLAHFNLRVMRKSVMMIPYLWKETEIFRYVDPKEPDAGQQSIVLNEPQEWDIFSDDAAVISVKNNLAGAEFDYVEAEGDNSPTSKQHEQVQFQETLQYLNTIDVKFWPAILDGFPNPLAKKVARNLREEAEAAAKNPPAPPPPETKLNVSLNDKNLNTPLGIEIAREMGVLKDLPPESAAPLPEAMPAPAAPPMPMLG